MGTCTVTVHQGKVTITEGSGGDVKVECQHPVTGGGNLELSVNGSGETLPSGAQTLTLSPSSTSTGPTLTGSLPSCEMSPGGFTILGTGDITVTSMAAASCTGSGHIVLTFEGTMAFSSEELPDDPEDIEVPEDGNDKTPFK